MKKILFCLCLLLAGCSSTKTIDTVKLSTVISNIKNDIQDTNSMSIDNFKNWSDTQLAKFDESIAEQQCQMSTPNPLISVFNDNFVLTVNGSFTKTGQFGIAASMNPNVSISGTLSKNEGQQISVPVNFVSLSSLPDFEFNKKLSLETVFISGNKSDQDLVKNELTSMLQERELFKKHISFLVSSYNPVFCLKNNFNNNSSFMTIKKRK